MIKANGTHPQNFEKHAKKTGLNAIKIFYWSHAMYVCMYVSLFIVDGFT